MKRYGKLYPLICTLDNIILADKNARKGKKNFGIKKHDEHAEEDNQKLLESLINKTYVTSPYQRFKIYEPKEREICRLPYYPDRIGQWALMNILESVWVKTFITQTYSCIKGRGIHKLVKDLQTVLKQDVDGTKYCLKLDVRKFYQSIDHDILKEIIRRKIKDKDLLDTLDEIIDSNPDGVPIGNYLSQFLANLFLTYLDHWIKEELQIRYYYRYADDIIILSSNKELLRKLLSLIKLYFNHCVQLDLKSNYQIFEVDIRGIDFIGYVFYHTHTQIRKRLKQNLLKLVSQYVNKKITKEEFEKIITAYFGWLKYCDSKHLLQSIEQKTGIHLSNWNGEESIISNFYNKVIRIIEVIQYSDYFQIHFIYKNTPYSINSTNKVLLDNLKHLTFPTNFKLIKYVRTKKTTVKCKT